MIWILLLIIAVLMAILVMEVRKVDYLRTLVADKNRIIADQQGWLERHEHYKYCLRCWGQFTENNPDAGGQMCQSCWIDSLGAEQ